MAKSDLEPGNDEEIEEGDEKKESETKGSWSMSEDFFLTDIMKSFDWVFTVQTMTRSRSKLKHVDVMSQTTIETMSQKYWRMEDPQRSKIPLDLTVFGLELGHNYPRN